MRMTVVLQIVLPGVFLAALLSRLSLLLFSKHSSGQNLGIDELHAQSNVRYPQERKDDSQGNRLSLTTLNRSSQVPLSRSQNQLASANNENPSNLRNDFVVYVVDSGIRESHSLLSRVRFERGAVFFPRDHRQIRTNLRGNTRDEDFGLRTIITNHLDQLDEDIESAPWITNDRVEEHGHGTFVASVLAELALQNQEQYQLIVVPLVVVDHLGQGDSIAVLSATQYAIEHRDVFHPNQPSILLLALAERQQDWWDWIWGYLLHWVAPDPFDMVFKLAHENGFVTIAAAGNRNQDACYNRKSTVPKSVIVVGAYEETGPFRAMYSSFGDCVSLFAPGSFRGASAIGDSVSTTMVGTSTAAPLVAGAFVRYFASHSEIPWRSTADQIVQGFLERMDQTFIQDMQCDAFPKGDPLSRACERTTRRGLVL